jgi:cytochrome b
MESQGMRRTGYVQVWDPLVRLFHWGVAGGFALAWATSDEDFSNLHVWIGYAVLALVAVRLVWGVIGTRHARFTSFVKGPRTVLRYLKDMARLRAPATVGHNPAAGAMIVALLVSLLATCGTGLMLYGVGDQAGPLAGAMAPFAAWEDALHEGHEFFAGLTLALVGFHVGGVLFSSVLHRENLIQGMITGRKRVHAGRRQDGDREVPELAKAA